MFLAAILSSYLFTLPFANECAFTPDIVKFESVPKINSSNNLIRKSGSHKFAEGQVIIVRGQVVDSRCIPVSDAKVEIWQDGAVKESHDPNFLYTGKTVTNNLGEFYFLTVMPFGDEKESPHINFRVSHQDFIALTTMMFFEDSYQNAANEILLDYSTRDKNLLIASESQEISDLAEQIYNFEITLHEYDFNKKF